jgi:signal transduction histidine kinase/CheY-like chemotaxis protein/CHASE3 domain sensor protein
MPKQSGSIARNLQITYSISIILLSVSLVASFMSIQELIDTSQQVNATNTVLIESENVVSFMKDAETGQRGYLITLDPGFLEPFSGSKAKALNSLERVRKLTLDNQLQQRRCNELEDLIQAKFDRMQEIIDLTRDGRIKRGDSTQYSQLREGKRTMDALRLIVKNIKTDEQSALSRRTTRQEAYVQWSRILIVLASLISIVITIFSYIKVKNDLDARLAKQREDEEKYRETSERIAAMQNVTTAIAEGSFETRSEDTRDDQLGQIGIALNNMAGHLEQNFNEISMRVWLQEGAMRIAESVRGERNIESLSGKLLTALTSHLNIPVGAIYVKNKFGNYDLTAAHALTAAPMQLEPGQGVSGQSLQSGDITLLTDLPENFFPVTAASGSQGSTALINLPLLMEEEVIGLIELGLLRRPTDKEMELLRTNAESMSIALHAAISHEKLQELFEETQAQSEELQVQHAEMEKLNSQLEEQTMNLQASEEELKVQQEELQQTNVELEERTTMLEEKNREVQAKAEELAQSTRYKSEFLANMSHELRTPLNSILLLSRLLADNSESNLSDEQVEYARVIQSSGNGLLWLIDEILDLSKIEAGKMDLDYEKVELAEIAGELGAMFRPMAAEKGIQMLVELEEKLPKAIETDKMRLDQVLKNLLSNAVKFTSEGSVTLSVKRCSDNNRLICISVRDTGIGIPKDKQHLVFQAFQQADGSTKRKYGGTGLGLSISRELIKLLGGEIKLVSEAGKGSEFTVFVPIERLSEGDAPVTPQSVYTPVEEPEAEEEERDTRYISERIPDSLKDDRDTISPDDKVILIVEDDVNFAQSLLEFTRRKGYKGVSAVRGDEALPLAKQYRPMGILLDIELPVKSGWEAMDELKKDSQTRHIPVHIMSSHRMKKESLMKGAVDFIEKPLAFEQIQQVFGKIETVLAKNPKKVLIIEDNTKHAEALEYFLESHSINTEVKTELNESIYALRGSGPDCVILDMGIPANNAYEFLEEVKKTEGLENLPIIIFTGKSLSMNEEQRIKKYADSIVIKTAHSYQRMLDEVSIFLHLVEEKGRDIKVEPRKLGALNDILENKTVLIADDDVRNIYSLTKALEGVKLNVIPATNGKEALEKLEEHKGIDIVLLDMMMPEMDGYETARHIRGDQRFKKLPVIAVTAKAMTGDREKCISAGASDYITKPVDVDQLLSLLRVWLYE